ncbi:MAG: Tfp pilus assembly protein PilX [Limisphaerales bacterium]|jgi:Tfp pilus assembly protein PilX
MKSKVKHHCGNRSGQRGLAVIFVLAMLSVMTAFAIHNSRTLYFLEQELKIIEKDQVGAYQAR